jgi:hypothetical protein
MRPLEIAVLLANLLAFVLLLLPLSRTMRRLRLLTLAVAQALVEGPRWQMAPAYALAGLWVWAWRVRARSRRLVAGATG